MKSWYDTRYIIDGERYDMIEGESILNNWDNIKQPYFVFKEGADTIPEIISFDSFNNLEKLIIKRLKDKRVTMVLTFNDSSKSIVENKNQLMDVILEQEFDKLYLIHEKTGFNHWIGNVFNLSDEDTILVALPTDLTLYDKFPPKKLPKYYKWLKKEKFIDKERLNLLKEKIDMYIKRGQE